MKTQSTSLNWWETLNTSDDIERSICKDNNELSDKKYTQLYHNWVYWKDVARVREVTLWELEKTLLIYM